MPSYKDYWSAHVEIRDVYISSVISRNRFSWFLNNLHSVDNSVEPKKGQANYDKLFKIRPLIDTLGKTFRDLLILSEYQAIDESMIKFRGRISFLQYMLMKYIKRGYKIWTRADRTGYFCEFQIYTGKTGETAEGCLDQQVIKDLSRNLAGKSHKIFDNYFNSVDFVRDLLADGIYCYGTIRRGRKSLPDFKEDRNMKCPQMEFFLRNGWINAVCFFSEITYHDPSLAETIPRRNKNGILSRYNVQLW